MCGQQGRMDQDETRPDSWPSPRSAKILLLNYPNNPTTVTADDAFFARAIAFCARHSMLLVHDNPYVDQV